MAPIGILGLSLVWLKAWMKGRQLYKVFYSKELTMQQDEWKDYYKILGISLNAQHEEVIAAYEKHSYLYDKELSDETRSIPISSQMRKKINEAYQVLSDPVKRISYDRVFWIRQNIKSTEISNSEKQEIIALIPSLINLVNDVRCISEREKQVNSKMPGVSKVIGQLVLVVVITFLFIILWGTSFALAKPEHTLAAPFKGIAITLTKVPSSAIHFIEYVRGIVAIYERNIVSTALQSMRIDTGLKEITPVVLPTNDMASFPSREHPLFPNYLETRLSQFKYTIDSNGKVNVDTSLAISPTFLEKTKRLLDRLEGSPQ